MNFTRATTLLTKECLRFFRVYNQTIVSPIINAIIFFIIFTFAFGHGEGAQSYKLTVAVGIVMMTSLQAAYYNTQSTITVAKVLGFIRDYAISPLKTSEILTALCLAAYLRAVIVGILTFASLALFLDLSFKNILIASYYFTAGTVIFAMLGIIIGFASQDFDKAQAYSSYIIVPLTMLSGTFYSIESLPKSWQTIVLFNPVFYIIDGFKGGIIGTSTHNALGFVITTISLPAFLFIANYFLKKNIQQIDS